MRLLTLDRDASNLDTTSTLAEVAALPGAGQVHVGPRDTRVALAGASIGGAMWDVEIRFEGDAISRVQLVARRPGDARSWDEWTMEKETARMAFHEDWAARVLGARFEPLRIEVDGKWIATQWPEPAPKQATFPWGQLRSAYDGHSSEALLVMMVGFVGG